MKVKVDTYHHGILHFDVPKTNICGDFAVTPAYQEDSGKIAEQPCGFDITHIPTGRSALPRYKDGTGISIVHEEAARELAQRYAELPKQVIDMGRLGDEEAMATIKKVWRDWRKG
jgi:hypothetical protein